ncbi:helix-turn-helix domain-containing protein [Caldithrix abyssi]|nr:helix-turn-helix domain-containing protein [Caldithrix abyssi]
MKKKRKRKYCSYCGSRTERLYSPESVARIFDCSVEKIRKMIQKREIGYKKIGRLVRIPQSELEKVGKQIPSIRSYLS